jgi:hypothetical protein
MLTLARRYQHFNPDAMSTATLPTTAGQVGAADVLFLEKTQAQAVIAAWEGTTTPAPPTSPAAAASAPTNVTVGVLNGSGVTGQARAAAQALTTDGFEASVSGNGRADSYSHQTSIVRYYPADLSSAQQLQRALVGGAELDPEAATPAGSLLLITGATYGGVSSTPAASPPTTTAAPAPASPAPIQPAFPGPHGQDPPPAGSGC